MSPDAMGRAGQPITRFPSDDSSYRFGIHIWCTDKLDSRGQVQDQGLDAPILTYYLEVN